MLASNYEYINTPKLLALLCLSLTNVQILQFHQEDAISQIIGVVIKLKVWCNALYLLHK